MDMKMRSGFTLIELLATVALIAIMLAIGIPSFRTMIYGNRLATQVNVFVTSISLARSEAVKRGSTVTVAVNTGGSGTTWHNGWSVFVPSTVAGEECDPADAVEEIRVVQAFGGPNTLKNTAAPAVSCFAFNGTGTLAGTASLDFDLCTDITEANRGRRFGRLITITTTGRVETAGENVACES